MWCAPNQLSARISPALTSAARFMVIVAASVSAYGDVLAMEKNAPAVGSSVWIQGSFVNLRQAARNDAAVVEQWSTNTNAKLLDRKGDWCEVESPGLRRGFVLCRLLGNKALALVDLKDLNPNDAARRAFWIAPSWGRLANAGQALTDSLLSTKQRETELQSRQPIRWVAPEFDAIKARMRSGVKIQVELEIDMVLQPVQPATLANLPAGALPRAARSLFLKRTDFLLSPSIDQAAAMFGSSLKLQRILRGPEFHSTSYEEWIDGAWDIGEAELSIDPPVLAYAIAANGMLSAKSSDRAVVSLGPTGSGCGGVDTSNHQASWRPRLGKDLPGFARIPSDQKLLSFYSVSAIRPESVQVTTREFRTSVVLADGQRTVGKVAVHAIDLDKDKVPDLVIIISQVPGSISAFLTHTQIFVNIGGVWSLDLDVTEDDCT